MKIMDINGQDECIIELVSPAKKKKMKQAQLPFQMHSPLESQNGVHSKKRKLTSPCVDYKSSKLVKISRKYSKKKNVGSKLNDSGAANESSEDVDIVEDAETENVKENTTSNKVETINKTTPRRSLTGQKKLDKMDNIKSSPLTKFLRKTDTEVESSKNDHENSSQEEKDESVDKDSDTKIESTNKDSDTESESTNKDSDTIIESTNKDSDTKLESTNKDSDSDSESDRKDSDTKTEKMEQESESNNEADDTFATANNSFCPNSDSDNAPLSSDNEDKDEQAKSTENLEGNTSANKLTILTTPKSEKMKKKLTPKQQERMLLSAKRKEEREKRRIEKEKKLEEERQNRKRRQEERRKEKEEKDKAEKEQKMMEKKMRELKKQMDIEQKQKEKQAKEEERRKKEEAKEEEKRKKEEEKLEAERKKQKAASNFTSFFVAKKQEKSVEEEYSVQLRNFMPFEVKADMKMAPVCRRVLNDNEKLSLEEKCEKGQTAKSDLYLDEIKKKKIVPHKSTRTWPPEAKDDVVLLDEENDGSSNIVKQNIVLEKQRTKLLQFSENRRPPYWGTWRKQSACINPRRPFARDMKWFNYEVDSDDEWEEEEPGESLRGSDDERDEEKDEENPDDNEYDVDNEFMVPHGYLSDEELRADEEDSEDMTPENQKSKLKLLGEQFESERNTKTAKLKPRILGCVWRGPDNKFAENVPQRAVDFLSAREAWVSQIPVTLPTTSESESVAECSTPTHQQSLASSKKRRILKEALPDLIRLLHGNTNGRRFLTKEFMTYLSKCNKDDENVISKASLDNKIREVGKWMACPEEGPMHLRACWYVPEETRKLHNLEDLSLPNRWSYNLVPKRKSVPMEPVEKLEKDEKEKKEEKKNVPLITQFTKKITQEEMKKQLDVKPSQNSPASKPNAKAPKRVALISVGRGEQFSNSSKENLMERFQKKEENKGDSVNDADEIVFLGENKIDDQSDGSKPVSAKVEDRLEVPMETDRKTNTKEKPLKNKRKSLKMKATKIKTPRKKNAKTSVVTFMDVDSPKEN